MSRSETASMFPALAVFLLISTATVVTSGQDQIPVKVFVLAGQSNMQGQAVIDLDHEEHYNGGRGILNTVMTDPGNQPAMNHLRNRRGEWKVRRDVFIRYRTDEELKKGGLTIGFTGYGGQHHFGPELQFGHVVGHAFDEPVLLIKTAWGGKSLQTDFRPPSSGGETGPYYQKMLDEVEEAFEAIDEEFPELAGRPRELAGFVWMQGWNDMVSEEAATEYEDNLVNLINDLRSHWDKPGLPVIVGELGNGGDDVSDGMQRLRAAQRAACEREDNGGSVVFVPTAQHARPAEDSPNTTHGHHWFGNAESYFYIGHDLGAAMVDLIHGDKPRVLILGDSISIGYTRHVRRLLADDAIVIRPTLNLDGAENCEGTKKGIDHIERWLELDGGDWDVIHFNFGLHDMKHVDPETGRNSNDPAHPEQSPPDRYREQLEEIVSKLKATGAELIFATTTPVPEGGVRPFRDPQMIARYNEIALEIMAANEVSVNDLNGLVLPQMDSLMRPVDVHFTPEGSTTLAAQVAEKIKEALER
ncbi:MAG: sialate O-acetylesterase [Planctomycetota bacterium]